jgi:hypothetical protein
MPFSHLLSHNDPRIVHLREVSVNIARMSLRHLRTAIQNNRISFPSQVPVFACQSRADIQWRLVELYFVHNWSCPELGERYGVAMERIRQLLSQWVQRAAVLGYLQEIPAEMALAEAPAARQEMARPLPPAVIAPVPLSEPLVHAIAASSLM